MRCRPVTSVSAHVMNTWNEAPPGSTMHLPICCHRNAAQCLEQLTFNPVWSIASSPTVYSCVPSCTRSWCCLETPWGACGVDRLDCAQAGKLEQQHRLGLTPEGGLAGNLSRAAYTHFPDHHPAGVDPSTAWRADACLACLCLTSSTGISVLACLFLCLCPFVCISALYLCLFVCLFVQLHNCV